MSRIKVPVLETRRLMLRGWRRGDARALYAYASNPHVGPDAGWEPHESVRRSRNVITQVFQQRTTWAITLRPGSGLEGPVDTPIGNIGLEPDGYRPRIHSMELGYSMSQDYWGYGIMTEAARRMLQYGFEVLQLSSVMIRTGEDNPRSRRVIEKCGFHYEGTLRASYRRYDGQIRDSLVYSLLREEYQELAALWERPEGGCGHGSASSSSKD